jgi:hypothetical protein
LETREIEIKKEDDEFGEYIWTDPKDLKTLNLTPPSIELFKNCCFCSASSRP